MRIEENLTDSFNYTKLLFNDFGRLLILVILDIIPIVNFIVVGYLAKVIKQPKNSNQLPPLENYLDLWIQGLIIVVATIIFMIIPIVLIIPFGFVYGIASWLSLPFLTTVGSFLAIILLLVGVLLAFFLAIILVMAIVNMVKHDSFSKAFAIGDILEIINKIGWGTYIVWIIVIFICAVIVSAIGSIPFIGWILALVLGPFFGIFVARSSAITYMEANPQEPTESVEQT